ncbi:MAG: EamA family transporter [Gammaproteobacteria bacterium]
MSVKRGSRWWPAVSLVLLSIVWGYTWVVAKIGLSYAPPFAFAAERSLGGGLALLAVLKLTGRPMRLIAPRKTLLIGLVQVTGFMLFQTWSLVAGGAGKTAVLVFTMPIWTLLMAWPILGERIRGQQWLAAISTLTGLVLIIEPWNLHASILSEFLGIMAALCWAVGTILIKRLRQQEQVDLLALTTWQMLFGAAALWLLAMVIPEHPTHWNLSYLGILIYMAVMSTALCWWLWFYTLDRIPAWEAGLSVLGTPVVAIVSSRLMLSEQFRPDEIIGILLIGIGLGLLSLFGWLASRRQSAPVPESVTPGRQLD